MSTTSTPGAPPLQDKAKATAETAADEASGVASSAKESAATVAHAARDEVAAVASEAAEKGKDLVSDARLQLRQQASEQAERVATALGDLGSQLSSMAEHGQPGVAQDVVRQVADQADRLAGRLSGGGLDAAIEDAKRLARNRPAVFLLGAAAAGVLVGRLAKVGDPKALLEAAKPEGQSAPALGSTRQTAQLPAPPAALTPAPRPLVAESAP